MEKPFDAWNTKKKEIDAKQAEIPFFREGEVWWVHLGLNVGFEMNGKGVEFMRPVIILKKYNQFSFLALPLSTSSKKNQYRIAVGEVNGKQATANLSQLKNIDSKRLINKAGHIETRQLKEIKKPVALPLASFFTFSLLRGRARRPSIPIVYPGDYNQSRRV